MGGGTHARDQILSSRARDAPARPGVYILLGDRGKLLYIGKASNMRRRLLDHARRTATPDPRGELRRAHVREVRWVECSDEFDAVCLEADLIVALTPTLNAVMADDAYTYIRLDLARDQIRVRLTEDPSSRARAYGAFPHLGKGKHSWRAVRTNGGFSALLRLLWSAFSAEDVRFRIPAKLRGSSPPVDLNIPVDWSRLPAVHDFLSGRSSRLVGTLREAVTADDVPEFMRRPLLQDLDRAELFYRLGPRALRELRRRHGVGPGVVDRDTFSRLVGDDLRHAIGDFRVPERPRSTSPFARRRRIAT